MSTLNELAKELEDEEDQRPKNVKWIALIIYSDASDIYYYSEHDTEEEAMAALKQRMYDSIEDIFRDFARDYEGNFDENSMEWQGWLDLKDDPWTLDQMNEWWEGENGIDTVFVKKIVNGLLPGSP